jgi:2-dehydropantoate 2-reductase
MKTFIKTISIIGAGAVGGAYGSILHDMDRHCVSFIASGDRFERLRQEGLIVNGRHYNIPVLRPDDLSAPPDLLMIAVKHHQLDDAIGEIRNIIGEQTTIISVMNGIESEEKIGAVYGMEKVLYAISIGLATLKEGNRVNFTKRGKIFIGEARNPFLTDRVKRLQGLFDRAGIICETPPDMIRALWWKFMVNVGINQASAVLRAPYSVFQTSQNAKKLMDSAMREVIMLAEKASVLLSEEDIEDWNTVLLGLNPEGKTSMLQDVEAGRKTEVEMLAGKVIELGKCYDVPTPVNQKLFELIKKIEAKKRKHGET